MLKRLMYGCWSLGGTMDDAPITGEQQDEAFRAYDAAYQAGYRMYDHSDFYAHGKTETVFGRWLKSRGLDRSTLFVQTKVGVTVREDMLIYNLSPDHIVTATEACLERLDCGPVDMLLLHRPEPLMDPERIAEVIADLAARGLARSFGVSNMTPTQMAYLSSAGDGQIVANQIELSVLHTPALDTEYRGEIPLVRPIGAGGTLEYCGARGIDVQAYSPLTKGWSVNRAPTDDMEPQFRDRIAAVQAKVAELAAKYDVAPEAIPLAWLLRHPVPVYPIVGSRQPERIAAYTAAEQLVLEHEDWHRLYAAGRGATL